MKESLLPTDANMRQKYNRGRRAKSECKKFTLPKDKNPGCRQEAWFF